jgi:hypothetical protein
MAVGLGKLGGKQTLIVSLYLDITLTPVTEELISVIEYAESKRFAVMLCVDSNAHGRLWMSPKDNSRGRALTDFFIERHMKIENIGNTPTFECSTGKSIIDLTLTRGLKPKVNNWRVCKKVNHSDHHTIRFTIEDQVIYIEEHRLWEKADWDGFTSELAEAKIVWPEYINSGVLDNLVTRIYENVNHALDNNCPMAPATKLQGSNPWFTKGLMAKKGDICIMGQVYCDEN